MFEMAEIYLSKFQAEAFIVTKFIRFRVSGMPYFTRAPSSSSDFCFRKLCLMTW
jgi:hypothetical protein